MSLPETRRACPAIELDHRIEQMSSLKRSQLPLSALRAFEAAARHESFAQAAEELSITQPAVSKQVSLLEARLGLKLFERMHRCVRLTWHGKRLAPRLTDALDRMHVALEELQSELPSADPMTIMVESDFAHLWLMPRLPAFERLVPEIPISVLTQIDPTEFDQSVSDCAVLWGGGWWANCESVPLFTNSAFPVCSPDVAKRLRNDPSHLHELRLIHDRTTDWWRLAALALDMPDLDWTAGSVYNQTTLCLEVAREGDGITIGDEVSSRWYLEEGSLAIPFGISLPCPVSYYFLWRPHGNQEQVIELLREWLMEQAREHRQWITEYWQSVPPRPAP